MKRVVKCACGEAILANAPILEFIRWLWRHRNHRPGGQS